MADNNTVSRTDEQKSGYLKRREQKATSAQDAMNKVFDAFSKDATDEQLAAAAGDNLFAYQAQKGLKRGAWGTALGSGFLGKFDTDTRNAAYKAWEQQHNAAELAKKATARKVNPMMVWSDTYRDGFGDNNEEALNKFYANTGIDNTQFNDALKEQLATAKTPQEVAMILANADDAYGDKLEEMGVQFSDNGIVMPHQRTYEEVLADKEREREAINYRTQQAELAKQRARLGLADLSAGIGNMIKGAGGVNVTPQTYQQMYDNLTAQQKQNYNMYVARMDAIKKREEDRAKELRQNELYQRAKAEERAFQKELAGNELAAKERMNDANIKGNIDLQKEKNKGALALEQEKSKTKIDVAQIKASTDRAKSINNLNTGNYAIAYGGSTYVFPNNATGKAAISEINSVLQQELQSNSKLKDREDLQRDISVIKVSIGAGDTGTYDKLMNSVTELLNKIGDDLSEEAKRSIINSIDACGGMTYAQFLYRQTQAMPTTQEVSPSDSTSTIVTHNDGSPAYPSLVGAATGQQRRSNGGLY